jgi:hypothetical protein
MARVRLPFTPSFVRARGVGALLATLAAGGATARATPRPLPFTYPAETLPKGNLEVEQYVDLVPVRVAREEAGGTNAVTSLRSELQTELEYGITNKLELGMYFAFEQAASATAPYLQFQGIKQRLRYELSEQPCWPLGVGLYLEVGEFHDEIELEQKVLLSKRFGPVGVGANLWVEQEYYFQDDVWKFIYNPTFGAYYDFSPHFSAGAEYWIRGRFDEPEASEGTSDVPTVTRHYAGPTLLLQAGEYFTSLGSYLRLDHLSQSLAVGDPSGRLWFRLLIGVLL